MLNIYLKIDEIRYIYIERERGDTLTRNGWSHSALAGLLQDCCRSVAGFMHVYDWHLLSLLKMKVQSAENRRLTWDVEEHWKGCLRMHNLIISEHLIAVCSGRNYTAVNSGIRWGQSAEHLSWGLMPFVDVGVWWASVIAQLLLTY